ncbi:MAG: 4-hydroxythreonine-4-phosphate dehydrogenase PdxA [Desulfovibrionales bacterium]
MTVESNNCKLVLTLGDPDGLGPELVCRLLPSLKLRSDIILIGPESALEYHCRHLKQEPFWLTLPDLNDFPESGDGTIFLHSPPSVRDFVPHPGGPGISGGHAAGESLLSACELLASHPEWGLVTCPLNKAMLQKAGFDFAGHTEFLAHYSGAGIDSVCMHLCGDRLRVSLVTTHPPLSRVPSLISGSRILRCLELTCDFLNRIGASPPSVAVCGLNPHAGEQGQIGREEIEIIEPAVKEAQARGLQVSGPFPADTVFYQAAQGRFAAVLAMYHDQGLAPLKLLHFHEAVNVTLGLSFVRTSVDHGTGYELVGKKTASTGSLRAALELAWKLCGRERAPS